MKSEIKMYQAKSAGNQVGGAGREKKQNGLKHILVMQFLKSDEILEIGKICKMPQATNPYTQTY